MIPFHRTPATVLMTVGGVIFVTAFMLPRIFAPAPAGLLLTQTIAQCAAAVIFTVGSCIYARGMGYPPFLGLFGLTLVGLLILMLLPDRFPENNDDDA